jgi:hypothetical protein
MFALLSLVVCLAANPMICETVTPDMVRSDGREITFFECLGASGQEVAGAWLLEHPQYVLRRIQCSFGNSREQLRERIETPEA